MDGRRVVLFTGCAMAPTKVVIQDLRSVVLPEISAVTHNDPGPHPMILKIAFHKVKSSL